MTAGADIAQPAKSALSAQIVQEFAATCRSIRDFAIVGIAATLVHYLVLIALISGGAITSLITANMLGFLAALFVSYAGNRFFVFAGKHGHLSGFAALSAGAVIAAIAHTCLLVGLTEGHIFVFLDGPMRQLGGGAIISLWLGILELLPAAFANFIRGEVLLSMSTTAAFAIACSFAAVMTYCWNRFIVFQPRCVKTAQP